MGWKIGSQVEVNLPNTETDVFRVVAIYDEGGIIAQGQGGDYFLGLDAFNADLPASAQLDLRVLVKAAPGVSAPEARRAIERITKRDFPSAKVQDQQEIKAEQTKQINQNLSFILVMLGLSVVIGVLGIANTLALSTFERTRELGLLRAVGMSRRQLRSSIRWEAVLISMVGTALGLGLGLIIGSALMLTYRNELPTARLGIPWPLLAEFCRRHGGVRRGRGDPARPARRPSRRPPSGHRRVSRPTVVLDAIANVFGTYCVEMR